MSDSPLSALEIARALIAFPSVTPAEAGALRYLKGLLDEAGFSSEIVTFASPGAPAIDNLYARIGSAAPNFVFAGHTDVVPPGEVSQWRFPPFAGVVADGRLWGRGAADMKGGVAAAVAAALRFVAAGPPKGSISFLLTGDEEGPANTDGTVKLLQWALARGAKFDHCVLGEPTSVAALGDTIKNGRRGSLTGRLRLIGKQGHVAYPHLAENPIRALAKILDALQLPPLDAGTPDFDASNLEIVTIDVGNRAANVIPAEVRLVFNTRFNDIWTPAALMAEIERRIATAAGGARYELAFDPVNAVAFLTPRGAFTDLVARAIAEVTGRSPALSTSGGTSDARFIKDACPVVEVGLVGASMHGVDENVAADDVEALSRIYERTLSLYFGSRAKFF
jgi:succinyl-diaminopimelate desuccinylase